MTRNLLAIILSAAILVMFVDRPWIDPTLPLSALFLLACGSAVAPSSGLRTLRLSFPMIPLACAVAWGVAGPSNTRLAVLTWAGNLVIFCLAMQVGRPLLKPLLAFASVLCVASVLQYFSGVSKIFWLFPADGPAWGPFLNRDQYAAFIEMVLPLALVGAFGGGRRALRFAVISAAMYASVIACASRAGAILTTAEIAIAWWRCGAANPGCRRLLAGVIGPRLPSRATGGRLKGGRSHDWLPHILLGAVFVFVAGGASLWHRFQDPDPFGGRPAILGSTLAMVRAHPWTGFGLGAFRTVYPAYASIDFGAVVQHAHNDWAEWAADGGIPFSLMLLSIAIWSARKAWRAPWAIGAIAVFVHAMVDFPLQKPALELWLFALLGVLAPEPGADPTANPD
jgi:hypothetical protein